MDDDMSLLWWEKIFTFVVQFLLYVLIPWETHSRYETALLIVTLGVISLAILAGVEWVCWKMDIDIKIPG